ncbi:MAG: hypothetical protein HEP71_32785 [Roseivirga sp.]|nr:hypothetical protein [Roseivirga sp.]
MKKQSIHRQIPRLIVLLTFIIISTTACGGDDDPTAQELAFEKLSGSWDLTQGGSIIIDGQDATANFTGFAFSFTDGGYSTTNAGDMFRASGTWQWTDEEAQQLSVDDGKTITIVTLTETSFVFTFTSDGNAGTANHGEGIAGNYTITVNQ